jgi:hypothetical protein
VSTEINLPVPQILIHGISGLTDLLSVSEEGSSTKELGSLLVI